MPRRRNLKDEEYWQHQRELVAEDSGHMGWTARDYPGCPERVRARQEQIEFAFDEASRD